MEVEHEDKVTLLKHNDLVALVFSTDVLVGGDHELQNEGGGMYEHGHDVAIRETFALERPRLFY